MLYICDIILTLMKKIGYIVFIVLLAAMVSSCARKTGENKVIIAKVSNGSITLDEFQAKLNKLPPYYQSIVMSDRKKYLEELILERLMYEEAVRRGIDNQREVKDLVTEAKKRIVIAKLIKDDVDTKVSVCENDLTQYYKSHKDDFKAPEMWRASHILLASETQAKEALAELAKGANFETLAGERSIDATSKRGGDVGYFRTGQVIPEFEKACQKLNPGETSDIVHTQFGYHIIRLTDKKAETILTYEEARPLVESEMKKRRRQELFGKLVIDLKNKYNVVINEAELSKVEGVKAGE